MEVQELENKLKQYGYSDININNIIMSVKNNNTYNLENISNILNTGGSGLLNYILYKNIIKGVKNYGI